MTTLAITMGAASAVYLFVGIVSWLVAALEMMGHNESPYMKWLFETSKKNVFFEGLSVAYLTLLWPVHLTLKSLTK